MKSKIWTSIVLSDGALTDKNDKVKFEMYQMIEELKSTKLE